MWKSSQALDMNVQNLIRKYVAIVGAVDCGTQSKTEELMSLETMSEDNKLEISNKWIVELERSEVTRIQWTFVNFSRKD